MGAFLEIAKEHVLKEFQNWDISFEYKSYIFLYIPSVHFCLEEPKGSEVTSAKQNKMHGK